MWLRKELDNREAAAYIAVQIFAAVIGVVLAHAMFDLPLLQPGIHIRTGLPQWLSEAVATFGLLLTILLGVRHRPASIPALVASYIFAAYWFTASTSFANPAVTIARSLTQTFAGIRPNDVLGFVMAQLVGAIAAYLVFNALVFGSNSKNDDSDIQSRETAEPLPSSMNIVSPVTPRKAIDWN
jgi:glycerol uptake facilitator-like aquaporin